jgi:uncharacterized OB-fold protein
MEDKKVGWQCPVCKRILAPSEKQCKKCNKQESKQQDSRQLLNE